MGVRVERWVLVAQEDGHSEYQHKNGLIFKKKKKKKVVQLVKEGLYGQMGMQMAVV